MPFSLSNTLINFNRNHQNESRKVFDFCNFMLALIVFCWVVTTSVFLGEDLFDQNENVLDPAHSFGVSYLIFGLIILTSIIFFGNKMNHAKEPNSCHITCLGFCIMLLGIVPFYSQTQTLEVVNHLQDETICPESNPNCIDIKPQSYL